MQSLAGENGERLHQLRKNVDGKGNMASDGKRALYLSSPLMTLKYGEQNVQKYTSFFPVLPNTTQISKFHNKTKAFKDWVSSGLEPFDPLWCQAILSIIERSFEPSCGHLNHRAESEKGASCENKKLVRENTLTHLSPANNWISHSYHVDLDCQTKDNLDI